MQKMRLFIHREDAVDALRAIQKLGNVEFQEVPNEDGKLHKGEKTVFEFNYVSSRLDQAVEFLIPYAPKQGMLKGMFEGSRVPVTGTELYETAKAFSYNEIIDQVQELQKKLTHAETRIKELTAEQELLEGWKELDVALGVNRTTQTTQTIFLKASFEAVSSFEKAAEENKTPLYVLQVNDTHYACAYLIENEGDILSLAKTHELEQVELPMRRGTAEEELERISRALKHEHEHIKEAEEEAKKLAKDLPQLRMVSDFTYWRKNKHDLLSNASRSENVLVFEGWAPVAELKTIEESIANKTKEYALEEIEPLEGELPPVEIKNNAIVKPFESVTRLYGLPGHDDIDPTMFLAGFFFIFFGLSLTDVGYGLILFLATGGGLLFYDVPKEMRPFMMLFMFGGLSSILVGLFFGGYFGVDMSLMPQWVQALQAFDPIKNPIPVFYLALGLGVVQILAGLTLKIVREAKNGDLVGGVLDQGPWILMFLSLMLWGAATGGLIALAPSVAIYAVYVAIASLILTQGRKEKNIFMKAFKGVFSLYDSISYLSDILSYSRLLALGLATTALAFAVNLIAGMVKEVPVVGFLLMAVILVVGHLFNLAVNVLGAFIHSSRLQFVEFFGKFISGTGRNFKPFKRDERYVAIKQ